MTDSNSGSPPGTPEGDRARSAAASPPSATAPEILERLPPDDVALAQRKALLRHARLEDGELEGKPGTYPIYPYTKGPNFANDGVGYGEALRVMARGGADANESAPGYSRRTRSGRVVIAADDRHIPVAAKTPAAGLPSSEASDASTAGHEPSPAGAEGVET